MSTLRNFFIPLITLSLIHNPQYVPTWLNSRCFTLESAQLFQSIPNSFTDSKQVFQLGLSINWLFYCITCHYIRAIRVVFLVALHWVIAWFPHFKGSLALKAFYHIIYSGKHKACSCQFKHIYRACWRPIHESAHSISWYWYIWQVGGWGWKITFFSIFNMVCGMHMFFWKGNVEFTLMELFKKEIIVLV